MRPALKLSRIVTVGLRARSRIAMAVATERVYYQQPTLGSCSARVLESGQDVHGNYLIFDKTIFHAQGGGQPLDEGSIKCEDHEVPVTDIREEQSQLRHYLPNQATSLFSTGGEVKQEINLEKRKLFCQLHSMGHLIAALVAEQYPGLTASKGNHFPNGQACVVFQGSSFPDKEQLKTFLQDKVEAMIKSDLKVAIREGEGDQPREMRIEGYEGMPCGGTHISSFGEIKRFIIRNIKKQKGELKIGYDVE